MNPILPQVEELISTFKQLMPTLYQQETLSSIFGLFLEGKVKLPHHCTTKSESAIMGISQSRTLKDGRKVSSIKTKGQQVYLTGLNFPVYLSWVWLKRDSKRIQRFVISTKRMKGTTITRWASEDGKLRVSSRRLSISLAWLILDKKAY